MSGLLAALVLSSLPAVAQGVRDCGSTAQGTYHWLASGQVTKANNCQGGSGFRCHPVEGTGSSIEKLNPACDPTAGSCAVKIHAIATIPGLRDMILEDGLLSSLTPLAEWYPCAGAGCSADVVCGLDAAGGRINFDNLDTWLARGLSCAQAATLNLSVKIRVCVGGGNCHKTAVIDLPAAQLSQALGCPAPPRKDDCRQCESCVRTGGCGTSVGGRGPVCEVPAAGAHLYYAAGGAGSPGLPGSADWAPVLGRNWSHSYAQRIVLDPDDSRVWLITPQATFREWSGLSGGVYATVSPSDEERTLRRTASGWELVELDGTVHTFGATGRWLETVDRNGNAKTAAYDGSGRLAEVAFPDGRRETFTYHPSAKLASITEVGVGGSPSRTWSYEWSGDDLTDVGRPDGTAWQFFYHPTLPAALTRWDLIGTDLARRVEGAWEYDALGNVLKAWRGDPDSNGLNAVERHTFDYATAAETKVTDPLGQVTTYTIARDTVSDVPKVTKIEGDCPVCGLGPTSQLTYGDAAHPLLPTEVIDGRGLRTQYTYDAQGQMTSRTDAAGTSLARLTAWQYAEPDFPAFATRIETPSTSGGTAQRVTVLDYNTAGDLETRTLQGAEAGGSFSLATQSTYNTAGQPLTVDAPGHSTADQTAFTYDPARGNLLPLTRTDPLIGVTAFGYDGFNRRTSVTDPNGVETVTAYDDLHRVTSVTQVGAASPGDDLVTAYHYNAFGDLMRTVLPRGNVIENSYDAAGRLVSVERKPDAATRGERAFYALDAFGHRIKEELQRWNGTAWVSEFTTQFVYSTRCHLDKVIHADGTVTENTYNCSGNLEKVWDAKHPRVTNPVPTQLYAYDALNRLSSLTQPWAGAGGGTAVTTYGYDVQDHLTLVRDAEGNTTTYVYSDRDLMTRETSLVSGITTYSYDEHGELVNEIDARGVSMTRTVDAADRVTQVDYPGDTLDITYTYDDPAVAVSKGRLTRIARAGEGVDYRYDRFGRITQDGELSYSYDKNGNPVSLLYPGGVEAVTTFDFADRPASLLARRSGSPDRPLVTAAGYLPSGPPSSVTLGNGLTETRAFNQRYFPASISLGSLLSWTYTTDPVGNILTITDALNASNNRTYNYQDTHYFLTQGNGPWGTRSWTYDKIGNRLTEVRGATTDTYSYIPSVTGGRSPTLAQVQPGGGAARTYQFGSAGHLEKVTQGADSTLYISDAAGRLSSLTRSGSGVSFRYDGRDYLTVADAEALPLAEGFESGNVCAWSGAVGLATLPSCPPPKPAVRPTYSSEGLLHALSRNKSPERSLVFHFAGRPVAQLDLAAGTETWKYLTTDHLGTPIAATSTGGTLLWQGGFEPFGADWSGAGAAGVFLRLPGQWEEGVWAGGGEKLYYNVHRWYEVGVGRYTRADPLGLRGDDNPFVYGKSQPIASSDLLGLRVTNRTSCTIYIKEAFRSKVHEVKPGETWPVEQDGYADPCKYPDQVFKTVDFVEVTVQADHRPEVSVNSDMTPFTSYIGSNTAQSNRGGWKGGDWLAKRHAEKDYGWDNLFNKAKAGNCCCQGKR